jgi:hypothetical protein
MAKVRQLADLFLRGALANETMKNLTKDQKELAEVVCGQVMDHDVLTGHKNMFMNKLGTTIRCDFTNRMMAQQEYRITIWRGVIYLLYHREYSFRCKACDASSYQSQRGAPIKFDRRWDRCPACKNHAIDDPRDSGLEKGSFIADSDYEDLILNMTRNGQNPPTVCSCIKSIPGKKKVDNPNQILNDPVQIKKFFGEFIWNYFRQSIQENKIIHHGKHTERLSGPVDILAVQCITQLLKVNKINFQCDSFSPVDGYFAIYCQPYGLDPESIIELVELKKLVEEHGGEIKIDGPESSSYLDNAILVKDLYGSAAVVEFNVAVNDQVQVVTNSVSKDEDDDSDIVQQLEKPNMNHDIREFEQNDTISAVRDSLPEGDCRTVLDLIINQGEAFDRFAAMYPDDVMANRGVPRQNKMAEFLGCSQKQIKSYRQEIHIQVVVHGVGK